MRKLSPFEDFPVPARGKRLAGKKTIPGKTSPPLIRPTNNQPKVGQVNAGGRGPQTQVAFKKPLNAPKIPGGIMPPRKTPAGARSGVGRLIKSQTLRKR